ncbi:MAG: flavodoxin family protein [Treponema sp.]|jgi:multimeric flavodoxin WrbA|nr:flavodoxin family protein [Treponema sp.]
MHVIAFNGSPHQNGTVQQGLVTVARELEQAGITVEILPVGNQEIRGCRDCRACRTLKRCVYTDDIVRLGFDKLAEADGIILGSPVYYGGIAGTFKCFLDRLFFPGPDLRYKVGAAVVSLRRSGGIAVFHQLNNYFNLAQMIITPSVYWDVIHGNSAEEALEDAEGMQILRIVGRNMAWLLKTLAAGKQEVPLPVVEPRVRTNFIHPVS